MPQLEGKTALIADQSSDVTGDRILCTGGKGM